MAIECNQNVTEEDASLLGWTVIIDFYDEQTVFLIAPGTLRGWKLNKLAADSQIAAFDIALFRQSVRDARCDIHGNCQRDTISNASRKDACNVALRIDERATREAWIGSGVGANVAFENCASSGAQWASNCAHDARACHGAIFRCASDGQDQLSNAYRFCNGFCGTKS